MKTNLLILFFVSLFGYASAQGGACPAGFRRVKVTVIPDNKPTEITWAVVSKGGVPLLSGTIGTDSLCIPADSCVRFTIRDAGGDGICCAQGAGRYMVWYDGQLVRSNYKFTSAETMWMGCPSCQPGPTERQIRIFINPDQYPAEISWNLMNGDGDTLSKGRTFGDTVCVPATGCLRFKMLDSFGDGICCNFGQGSYQVFSADSLLFSGGSYTFTDNKIENCPPGYDCSSAIPVSPDTFTTFYDDTWYRFKPDTTGRYVISTCNIGNTCSTKIWVYDYCNNLQPTEGNASTIAYSNSGCGSQALLSVILEKNIQYYIRIGDEADQCNPDPVSWALSFTGPIVGCMDSTSCTYNPLATVNDNSLCLYNPNPNCPEQPDLIVQSDLLRTSFKFDSLDNNDPCFIQEGCLKGMGKRYILRFSTRIENIGDADYYIGRPPASPSIPSSQWIWDPCHGHWHYKGYAEYLLFDKNSNPIPAGFKAGFCVMDLNCSIGGGIPKYNCTNQGVTAGCGDIYDRSLKCQWVDVTEVDTGSYTLVARVNWDNSPDKLGRTESNLFNNWGQFCVKLSKNSSGRRFATVLPQCNPFVDCQGQVFGSARRDCKGVCQGTAVHGDVNNDTLRNEADLEEYLHGISEGNMASTPCSDLNGDSALNVVDAAMLLHCLHHEDSTGHADHCEFGPLFMDMGSVVKIGVDTVNAAAGYADLNMLNTQDEVSAFQFRISGVVPDSVQFIGLGDSGMVHLMGMPNGNILSVMAGNRLPRHTQPTRFLRLYFDSITGQQLCVAAVQAALSPDLHMLAPQTGACKNLQPVSRVKSISGNGSCRVVPNPFSGETLLHFPQTEGRAFDFSLFDAQGKRVFAERGIRNSPYRLDASRLNSGLYRFVLHGGESYSGTLMLER